MARTKASFGLALVLALSALTACASNTRKAPRTKDSHTLLHVGEPFDTPVGKVFIVRVQKEYRLIRCIPSGPIAGCYEDLAAVAESGITWNSWTSVPTLPGLDVNFISPQDIAIRLDETEMLAATVPGSDMLGDSTLPVALLEFE